MRRGCLSLAALSEKRSPVFASWLTNPSWQSCRVASSSRLWTESRVERPSHPEVNQRDALKKNSTSQEVAFIEQSSSRISHNGRIETEWVLCGLRVCIAARRRMTNMVVSQALLSNLSEIAPEHSDRRVAHRDVCGKCLQEKKTPTSGPRWSLYPDARCSQDNKRPQVLRHKPLCAVQNIVVVQYGNSVTKMWHVCPRL